MKIKAALISLLITVPSVGLAGFSKHNHALKMYSGSSMAANEVDEVKGGGPTAGLEYRFYLTDVFSIGANADFYDYGEHFSDEDQTDVDVVLLSGGIMGRLDFWTQSEWASYLGFGITGNNLERDFHDPDGIRTENTTRSGYFGALGFDAPFTEFWMWGAELRSMNSLGVSSHALALRLSLTRRFGHTKKPADSF